MSHNSHWLSRFLFLWYNQVLGKKQPTAEKGLFQLTVWVDTVTHGGKCLVAGSSMAAGVCCSLKSWWNRKPLTGRKWARYKTSRLTPNPSDPLPPPKLPKVPQPSKSVPPAGDQVFKHMSVLGDISYSNYINDNGDIECHIHLSLTNGPLDFLTFVLDTSYEREYYLVL